MTFVIRKFDYTESLGEKLKTVRQCANKTLSEMAAMTKIRKSILKSFEMGNYTKLPDPVYARNFLKIYVRSLGGNVDYFMKQFEYECGTDHFTKQSPLPRQRPRPFQFLVPSRFIKIVGIILVALAMITYLGFQIRAIVSPPELMVYEPLDGMVTQEAFINVTGQAQEGAQVKINGVDILLSQQRTFETEIALERGLNIISIQSTKRYSQPAIEYRRVVFQQDPIFSLAP